MVNWVVLDFETSSACDLKAAGAWRYAEDPTTEILCLTYSRKGEPWKAWLPGDPIPADLAAAVADPAMIFVAHNVQFEKAIWRHILVPLYGWPDIPNSRWHDTMATCAMRGLPLALEDAARVLRLPHQKDMDGAKVLHELMKPSKRGWAAKTPEKVARVVNYCGFDTMAEVDVLKRLSWLPARERNVWLLDQRINERGVKLDLDFVGACREVVDRATVPLAREFADLTGGLSFTQRDKVLKWCHTNGAQTVLPDLKKETLKELLGSGVDADEAEVEQANLDDGQLALDLELPRQVRRALEIRQLCGSAAVKKLPRMQACVGSDGRARGVIQYHGAGSSGRFAGRLFQPHNFPTLVPMVNDGDDGNVAMDVNAVVDAIMSRDPEFVEAVVGLPPIHACIAGLRHAITAEPDRKLVAADYSGIEARILLALCGQRDKADLMAAGADVYCDMASTIYKRPITKKNDPVERDIGKRSVLGLGYGLGFREFWRRYLRTQGFPLEFGKTVVDSYRKDWAPKVPEFWYELERASTRAVWDGTAQEAYGITYALHDGWLCARLPSGRLLWYWNPQKTKRAVPWDENYIRPGWSYETMKTGHWKTVHAFGGQLTGQTIQAIARDLLVDAMFKCEKENLPICITVHDEAVTEPKKSQTDAETVLRQVMLDSEPWARQIGIPINVGMWTGERYRK